MTYKFEIENNSLLITEGSNLVLDRPKQHIYYNSKYLSDDIVVLHDLQYPDKNIVLFKSDLEHCVDSTNTPFTKNGFVSFVRENLGRK